MISESVKAGVTVLFYEIGNNPTVNDTSFLKARCFKVLEWVDDAAGDGGAAGSSEYNIPNVLWDDIGGLDKVRDNILEAIELPLKHPGLFRSVNLRRSGILLFGPPGTGKTLVAKAVATECGIPFVSVKGPELLDSYVGGSEANVRKVFETAREASEGGSCVLFFDELDSLAPYRDGRGDGGGAMDRVVSMLLAELDDVMVGGNGKGNVFVIAATNRPDLLDTALLRPGRLEKLVYLGLTTDRDHTSSVLKALCRKFTFEKGLTVEEAVERVSGEIQAGLSGADLSSIASGAMERAMARVMKKVEDVAARAGVSVEEVLEDWTVEECTAVVKVEDLREAGRGIVPSVTLEQRAEYEVLRKKFSSESE